MEDCTLLFHRSNFHEKKNNNNGTNLSNTPITIISRESVRHFGKPLLDINTFTHGITKVTSALIRHWRESKGFLSFIQMPSGRAGFRIRAIEYRDSSTCLWNACLLQGRVYHSIMFIRHPNSTSGVSVIRLCILDYYSNRRFACTITSRRRKAAFKLSTNNLDR